MSRLSPNLAPDTAHLREALRYSELNPVCARMVATPKDYPWSSAAVHCGLRRPDAGLDLSLWSPSWTAAGWKDYLAERVPDDQNAAIRRKTHTGRPLGAPEFVERLETLLKRKLRPETDGHPTRKPTRTNRRYRS